MPRIVPTLGALAIAGLVGGCDGAGEPSKATSASPPSATVDVSIENIEFAPMRVTVRVGQRVRWTNADAVAHTVAANDGAEFSSRALRSGDTFAFVPTRPGTVNYFCTIHQGQVGTLVVR